MCRNINNTATQITTWIVCDSLWCTQRFTWAAVRPVIPWTNGADDVASLMQELVKRVSIISHVTCLSSHMTCDPQRARACMYACVHSIAVPRGSCTADDSPCNMQELLYSENNIVSCWSISSHSAIRDKTLLLPFALPGHLLWVLLLKYHDLCYC